MWDLTVPKISLAMLVDSLENMPVYELPARYDWRYFRNGDVRAWAEIETSAGEFRRAEDGMERFRVYYPSDEQLGDRMLFLTDGGVPFATATAWYDDADATIGRLHWVSVDEAHQGQGLSKALVSLTMHRMRELGYASAYLTTQTMSWVAIKVYYQFGFRPYIRDEKEIAGWRIVSEKTGIDFMQYI